MTTTARDVASELAAVVGREHVLTGDIAITLYGRDGSIQDDGDCGLVVLPANTDEVSGCMRVAAAAGLDVVPRGSGTGLTGGAVPLEGSLVISLTRMNRIIEINDQLGYCILEPGVGFFDLWEHLKANKIALQMGIRSPLAQTASRFDPIHLVVDPIHLALVRHGGQLRTEHQLHELRASAEQQSQQELYRLMDG